MAAVMLTGIVAVYHLWLHVSSTTVALTLLLLVLFLAAQWGLRYAVATSLVATAGVVGIGPSGSRMGRAELMRHRS